MFTKNSFSTFVSLVIGGLAIGASVSAQNNLTAKASSIQPPIAPVVESDRIRDGLAGPVRRVRTEVAKLSNINGRPTEEKRVLLEVAAYDIKGGKTENQYFPVAGSNLTGKEVYKYDDKGNISEMIMVNGDGSLLSREVYKYDYDAVGNWTRMTTSVAVIEAGKVTFEPSEVTYRAITYYLDENMMKLAQPAPEPPAPVAPTPNKTANSKNKSASRNTSSAAVSKAIDVQLPHRKPVTAVPAGSAAAEQVKDTGLAQSTMANSHDKPMVMLASEPPPVRQPKSSDSATSPAPLLKPVSGGVLNGKALNLPAPTYPDLARRMRTAGVVIVEVVLDENGRVISALATTGPPTLRDAAIQAALKARFSPTTLSGQPVKVTGQINYKFSLTP